MKEEKGQIPPQPAFIRKKRHTWARPTIPVCVRIPEHLNEALIRDSKAQAMSKNALIVAALKEFYSADD